MTWTLHPQLTEHEIAVLRLLARGRPYLQIASLLKVSPETAGTLIARMRSRLGAHTNAHAVAIGYETGILTVQLGRQSGR